MAHGLPLDTRCRPVLWLIGEFRFLFSGSRTAGGGLGRAKASASRAKRASGARRSRRAHPPPPSQTLSPILAPDLVPTIGDSETCPFFWSPTLLLYSFAFFCTSVAADKGNIRSV
ncbi:hypothetical protein TW95_gp1752 [Pandoravirus inopinatum]|uniref:Uncharacterized protein n=1 Tax=Pandoravirus inopinatum TaxID=1605721 RepID=A0A0B5JBS5_9VIRU|nr:hypothetical protein TW95_gp1752 [Pandoravirus inopinatum]AJF98486.1 hypothetical protein [Pandoravirus inopinatum]